MKTVTKTLALDALMVAVALALPVAAAQAEVDVTLSRSASQSADIMDGYEAKASLSSGNWNLWASYGTHDQIMVTQSVGSLDIIGAGVGYNQSVIERVSLYVDAGMAVIEPSYRERIIKEAAWFSFKPTFDEAHWLPDDNYLQPGLEYEYDFDHATLIRVGAQFEITDNLSFDIHYRLMHAKQDLLIRDPAKAEQHGWWEGTFDRDLSGLNIGINWEF